ncbi:MAG: response regulator [Patescibacteria group bacterium]
MEGEGGKEKILIIEDDRFISKMYQTKLSLEGYTVETAENGAQGVEKIKSFLPDIVLLDIIMPEMDGFGVLEAIRDDDTINSTPVVVMSNLAQEDHLKRAKALGAKDYIVKSQLTPMDVVKKIKEILAR